MLLNELYHNLVFDIGILLPGFINPFSEIRLFGNFSLEKVSNRDGNDILATLFFTEILLKHKCNIVLLLIHGILSTLHAWGCYDDDPFF